MLCPGRHGESWFQDRGACGESCRCSLFPGGAFREPALTSLRTLKHGGGVARIAEEVTPCHPEPVKHGLHGGRAGGCAALRAGKHCPEDGR